MDTDTFFFFLAAGQNIFKLQLYNEYGLKVHTLCFNLRVSTSKLEEGLRNYRSLICASLLFQGTISNWTTESKAVSWTVVGYSFMEVCFTLGFKIKTKSSERQQINSLVHSEKKRMHWWAQQHKKAQTSMEDNSGGWSEDPLHGKEKHFHNIQPSEVGMSLSKSIKRRLYSI